MDFGEVKSELSDKDLKDNEEALNKYKKYYLKVYKYYSEFHKKYSRYRNRAI